MMRIAGLILMMLPFGISAAEIEIRGAESVRLGDYTLQLDGSTTVWIDTDAGTIRIGKPGEPKPEPDPKPDPPPTGIESLEAFTRAAFDRVQGEGPDEITVRERQAVANVFGELDVSRTGVASNEKELGQATTEGIRRVFGSKADKVRPVLTAIFAEANRLRDAGQIVSIDDWAKAWRAIAKGAEP